MTMLDGERGRRVADAAERWARSLVDTSGSNRLLFFRHLRAGTLDLAGADQAAVGRLLAGRSQTLGQLFPTRRTGPDRPTTSAQPARARPVPGQSALDRPRHPTAIERPTPDRPAFEPAPGATIHGDEPDHGGNGTDENGTDGGKRQADARRRLRTIRARMRELAEERGLDAGYLVSGFASWPEPESTGNPDAPVLLYPLRIEALTATETDFRLRVDPTPIVNPVLLVKLARDYRVGLTEDELLSELPEGDIDPGPLLDRLQAAATGRIDGFRTSRARVIGTFVYEKLPMVQDIERNADLLAGSDVVAALAGDVAAATALAAPVPVPVDAPDSVPPEDEFLVLDADSSQNYVVNAVVAGQHLVVKGPPGTGKSQTIANIIAALAARGRTTLFVAEKRAAIEAVLHRLASVGLDDLVMNLHGGGTSRRELAQALGGRLQRIAQERQPDVADLGRQLTDRRGELVGHHDALHRRHQPWGLSASQIQESLLALGPAGTGFRWQAPTLHGLDPDTVEDVVGAAGELARLGDFDGSLPDTPWRAATIAHPSDVPEALTAAGRAAYEVLPRARRALDDVLAEVGLRPPADRREWRDRMDLLDAVAGTLRRFAPAVFDGDLDRWLAATADRPARRSATVSLGWWQRRAATKEIRALWRGTDRPTREELNAALRLAAEQRDRWRRATADGGPPRAAATLPAATAALADLERTLAPVRAALPDLDGPPDRLSTEVEALAADQRGLRRVARRNELRATLVGWHLTPLLGELAQRRAGDAEAERLVRYAWLHSILDHIALTDARYAAADPDVLTTAAAGFRRADRAHIAATPARIRRAAAAHLVATLDRYPDQQQLVRREAAKKARHRPVRELFRDAPEVLLAVKPCWAMSPLLVSQVLPAQRLFDVVVFDEASQVEPVDGITSIMRGRQVVVAGDEHQLPPTRFFASDHDPTDDDEGALTDDVESLLQAFAAALPLTQNKHLAWHYRSRDERLIAFSNRHIYAPNGNELVTFPGAATGDCIDHILTPPAAGGGADASGTGRITGAGAGGGVGGGGTESVTAEVDRVVRLVLDHATHRPDESLGVITMGLTHAERVDVALRHALADRPDLDPYFRDRAGEPFFVKSIERVQGDERDAIILSVGYGRTPDGRMLYRFGPINNAGGHRRLNVAVTRARRRATVVSSFAARDLDPGRLGAFGAKLLRAYLEYAELRGERLDPSSAPPLNPFEADVRDRLAGAGIAVVPQYGASGYRIDFAVPHPHRPGEMVLAIEADGASYHSSPTARDRDRLRQEHLERLGWRFHRIWSTAWFRDAEAEVARVRAAYEAAIADADHGYAVRTATPRPTCPDQEDVFVSSPDAGGDAGPALARPVREQPALPEPARALPEQPDRSVPDRDRTLPDRDRTLPDLERTLPLPDLAPNLERTSPEPERALPRPRLSPGSPITEYHRWELADLVRWIESDGRLRTEDEILTEAIGELGFRKRGSRIVAALRTAIADARRPEAR
ncbi:AAA domain-containing protein [Plantactinospora sp. GCM10030261]|uniref:AAA domain-containing protein n=1 Tax=Plantactinospora sp. GCM10030261 TaxID=3273420 RepID=UPI003608C2FC